MKNLKKHPIFAAVFALLLCVFAAGAAYDFLLWQKSGESAKKAQQIVKKYEAEIQNAPTDESLKKADENLNVLQERLDSLDKELSRDSSKVLAPSEIKQGYELVEKLRSQISEWNAQAAEKGIEVPETCKYSFENYLNGRAKPTEKTVQQLWRQAMILDNILQKLFKSKPENAPMRIVSVQREALADEAEAAPERRTAAERRRARVSRESSLGDTFKVDPYISAKKDGSVSTQGFRIVFTGYTENMRRFLNQLNSFDLMLVVRSVEVKPYALGAARRKAAAATEENEVSAADFGGAAAAEEPEEVAKDPVVSENVSEFTFVIEYVEVDKNFSADAPEKQGEAGDSEEKAEE
ncbi:MAG: Amuc_1100 family pilus-like protein [Opitutales bacterium]|nr:Amuc_1100 family pilus-like protein [Opitutales bacterium]